MLRTKNSLKINITFKWKQNHLAIKSQDNLTSNKEIVNNYFT